MRSKSITEWLVNIWKVDHDKAKLGYITANCFTTSEDTLKSIFEDASYDDVTMMMMMIIMMMMTMLTMTMTMMMMMMMIMTIIVFIMTIIIVPFVIMFVIIVVCGCSGSRQPKHRRPVVDGQFLGRHH